MEYEFSIGEDGRIIAVSDNWDAFAEANDGPEARAKNVLGRHWSDFVTGKEVQLVYRHLIDKARQTGRPVRVPFRCDGPTVRRYMKMAIESRADGGVTFRCRLLREEPREPVPLLDRTAARGDELLSLCGWCARAKVEGRWLDLEKAVEALDLFGSGPVPAISHGICRSCRTALGIDLEGGGLESG